MRARRMWHLLALVAVSVLLLASAERTWRETLPDSGVSFAPPATGGAVAVASVEPGGAAEQAGLRAGDRVLEIGGHPVRSALVARDLLAQARPERPLGLIVLRDGASETMRIHPRAETHWRPDRIVGSFVALLFLLAGIAAVLRPRPVTATGIYIAWCLSGALLLGVTWSFRGDRLDWILFWTDRVARLALPALWVHLVLALRGSTSRFRRWLPVIYAPAAALLLAEVHLVGLGGALRSVDPVALVEGLRGRAEMGWLVAGMLAGFALLAQAAFMADEARERARARWFLAGTGIGLLPFVMISGVPEIVAGGEPGVSWIALPFLGLLPLVFTGAVLEYRLMDLAFFTRRVITVLATLAFSIVLFLGLLNLTDLLLPAFLHPAGIVPPLVAGVITAALAPAIRAGTRDMVGRVFYRRRYNFRRALARVARDLNAERDLPRLAGILERRIAEALDGQARLLLVGPGGTLIEPLDHRLLGDALSANVSAALERGELQTLAMITDAPAHLPELNLAGMQVLVPLRVEDALIAVLAAGPRPGSGSLLDSDDVDLLRSVAAHAAAAVAGAMHLAELKEQVQLVQRLQARTESLIDSSPLGMVVIDREGRIQHWNAATEVLLHVRREDALARSYTSVLPLSLRSVVREFHHALPEPGCSRAYRVRLGGASGDKLVDLAASPLKAPDGSEGLLLTLDDVTDRVRLEEQLIQQDRLASIGLLAAGVAHEVNTPLTGISSYAQMLLEEIERGDPRRPMLEKIVQQAGRASQIARGLLRFSRPGPALEMNVGPVDLHELFDETVGLLGPQIRKAKARVECRWNGSPAVATGDRARLQQVAMNLLLNALDAVSEGGHVIVRAGTDHDVAWFDVEDDGVGIPEHVRARIFDPFFTTKKPGQGTGLGLSISYGIVREHGGALLVDSEPGKGTTMRVKLPAMVPAALPVEAQRRGEERRAV